MGIEIGLRHSGYVESIVTIEEWGFGRPERGREGRAEGDRTEKAVGRGSVERGGSERKGVVYCTFVSFSGYTTEKSYDGGGKGADRQGVNSFSILRAHLFGE